MCAMYWVPTEGYHRVFRLAFDVKRQELRMILWSEMGINTSCYVRVRTHLNDKSRSICRPMSGVIFPMFSDTDRRSRKVCEDG